MTLERLKHRVATLEAATGGSDAGAHCLHTLPTVLIFEPDGTLRPSCTPTPCPCSCGKPLAVRMVNYTGDKLPDVVRLPAWLVPAYRAHRAQVLIGVDWDWI